MVTPGQTGNADDPPKKAIEALKAAAIILDVQHERLPSRDKRTVLSTFLEGTRNMAVPHDLAVQTWSAYRYGTMPPEEADLNRFVNAVEQAFR